MISCASQKHDFWACATRFFGKVQHGDYEGIISTLALMECITGLKDFLAYQGVRDVTRWESAVKAHIEMLYKMPNLQFIDGTPTNPKTPQWLVSEVLAEGLKILTTYKGKAVDDRRERGVTHLKFDGLYAPDAIHIVLAKKSGCSRLATFDTDFVEARKEIEPIVLNTDSSW